VDRQHPALVWVEALQGKPNSNGEWSQRGLGNPLMEEAVATAAILADPRRRDGTAHLALLATANDLESLERLLVVAQEQSSGRGRYRLVGPIHLSPHLGQGALMDSFNLSPPLYTPYNAPYLPEVLASGLEPVQSSRLYYAPAHTAPVTGPAHLRLLHPAEIPTLLPKLLVALDGLGEFPAPDPIEADFLLAWWQVVALTAWVGEIDGAAVGFVLTAPDLGGALRRADGARAWHWRLWWRWRRQRGAQNGRILALAVLPAWRRQGIGRQLWQHARGAAQRHGLHEVSVGPVVDNSAGAHFLIAQGAEPRQRYTLFGTA
jgi:GNAT superfamily N-acetyltransferase